VPENTSVGKAFHFAEVKQLSMSLKDNQMPNSDDIRFLQIAFEQARKGASEGGVPVGACLVLEGEVISVGRNRRQQEQAIIFHGETDCLRNAGLDVPWHRCTMYTSLSPCMMCAGTIVQFRIPRLVIGDKTNFGGNEDFLRSRGVEVLILEDDAHIEFFAEWKATHEEIWNGDIGE